MLQFPDPDTIESIDQSGYPSLVDERSRSDYSSPQKGVEQNVASSCSDQQFITVKAWLREALLALDESRNKVAKLESLLLDEQQAKA